MLLKEASPSSPTRARVRVRARDLRTQSTSAEKKLWHHLRDRRLDNRKFRRQFPIAGYFADFACVEAKLIVELDGGQHFEPCAQEADRVRTSRLKKAGFDVLRFDNVQALTQTNEVLTAILQWLDKYHPHRPGRIATGEAQGRRKTHDEE